MNFKTPMLIEASILSLGVLTKLETLNYQEFNPDLHLVTSIRRGTPKMNKKVKDSTWLKIKIKSDSLSTPTSTLMMNRKIQRPLPNVMVRSLKVRT